jgi:hypothetical protein
MLAIQHVDRPSQSTRQCLITLLEFRMVFKVQTAAGSGDNENLTRGQRLLSGAEVGYTPS